MAFLKNCVYFDLIFLVCLAVAKPNSFLDCPSACICYEEHWSDIAFNEWLHPLDKEYKKEYDNIYLENNMATYYDNYDPLENPLMKIVTCIIQPNEDDVFLHLPTDSQVIIIIQGGDSENITVKSSSFKPFSELVLLEIKGSESFKNKMKFLIDDPLKHLGYLNFEFVLLEGSEVSMNKIPTYPFQSKENEIIFLKPIINESKIVPYEVYLENKKRSKMPVFRGFENLQFLRIFNCGFDEIEWHIFDNLNKLTFLYLQNNNIKFIPEFAFYALPKLQFLSLANNNLLDIQLTDLSGLLELQYLDLSYNNFSQLSELSFPPLPKLKVADFRNNPISIIYPNTFEVMNTTESIILGNNNKQLALTPNSFLGLNNLQVLKLYNLNVPIFKSELLKGMLYLNELYMTGSIPTIEFDAFVEVKLINKLVLSNCNISTVSVDVFYGLKKLMYLDLSNNNLTVLSPGIFDGLTSIKEIMLDNNKLSDLPKGIFYNVPAKLIRLSENPWHCSCNMRYWNPMIINKVKKLKTVPCTDIMGKGRSCQDEIRYSYIYDNRVAPKCNSPEKYRNWGIFHVMRKELRCHKQLFKTNKLMDVKMKKQNNIDSNSDVKVNNDGQEIKENKNAIEKNQINIPHNQYINNKGSLSKVPMISKKMQTYIKENKYKKYHSLNKHNKNINENKKYYKSIQVANEEPNEL